MKELFLKKFDNKEKFTEEELRELIFGGYEVDLIVGENLRWNRYVTSIIEINDRFFAIEWSQGLTELQLNEFDEQPYEVKMIEKQIIVKDWQKL